jgi:hypothetical protein
MIFEDLVKNSSLTVARTRDVLGDDGVDVLVVVAKLSFRFDARQRLRIAARPVRRSAELDDGGGVRFPPDFDLPFGGTDCIVAGTAIPFRVPTDSRLLAMAIGSVKKTVRLFGPRVYMKTPLGVRAGPSAPIVATPLRFDHCYGGYEPGNFEARVAENPIGRGFALDPERLVGSEAHRLEPANQLGLPVHASGGCFAPIDHSWEPRNGHGGTYDERWRRKRAPAAPSDRSPLYHSTVRPEQRSSTPLTLPFTIDLVGFVEEPISLALPAYGIDIATEIERGSGDLYPAPLTRVIVSLDERVVELAFVASVPLPLKWERLQRVRVLARGSLPDEVSTPDVKPQTSPSVDGSLE